MVEIVYNGKDNAIDLQLLEDSVAVDLSSVTRMTIVFDTKTIDSDISADAFDWSEGNGKLILALGAESITTGVYDAVLTIFDSENTNGIAWGDFEVVVRN